MKAVIYLVQVSACTGIFYIFYYLFLRRLTFFRLNRWYLLATLMLSFVIPALTIRVNTTEPSVIMRPVIYMQQVQQVNDPAIAIVNNPVPEAKQVNLLMIGEYSYLLIASTSFIHLLLTLILFFRRARSEKLIQVGNVKVLKGNKLMGNSSFMNVIFINDEGLESAEVEQVIAHELLHVNLLHSADRLVAKLVQVVLWFNPFVYLYLRSIEENHEFEVDRIAAGNDDKGRYAKLLFKLAASGHSYLFHGFSKVPVKKRIAMLFNQPTKNMKKIIYVLMLPLVVISCLAFANFKNAGNSIKKAISLTVEDSVKITPIQYDTEGRAILAAKTDAPQSIINEYTALLKKCSLPYKKGGAINLRPNCSAAEREQLKTLYIQMSRKQQLQQYVWIRPKDPMPFRFKHNPPTQQQLDTWQKSSPENHFVAIDGYRIKKNDELAKYKLTDFNYAGVSIGHNLYKYNNGKPKLYKGIYYIINLETNGYYDRKVKEIFAKTEWHVNQFSKQREELVMANW